MRKDQKARLEVHTQAHDHQLSCSGSRRDSLITTAGRRLEIYHQPDTKDPACRKDPVNSFYVLLPN